MEVLFSGNVKAYSNFLPGRTSATVRLFTDRAGHSRHVATVVFPFFYNVLLSLSNMSLTNFQDWSIIGLRNYFDVFTEAKFFGVLLKTILWTVVNIVFHVSIGVALALALNGPIRGKTLYRVLLIIPWAVPAYITALTWRSMFHFDYGAVNLLASKWFWASHALELVGRSQRWPLRPASLPTYGWAIPL